VHRSHRAFRGVGKKRRSPKRGRRINGACCNLDPGMAGDLAVGPKPTDLGGPRNGAQPTDAQNYEGGHKLKCVGLVKWSKQKDGPAFATSGHRTPNPVSHTLQNAVLIVSLEEKSGYQGRAWPRGDRIQSRKNQPQGALVKGMGQVAIGWGGAGRRQSEKSFVGPLRSVPPGRTSPRRKNGVSRRGEKEGNRKAPATGRTK